MIGRKLRWQIVHVELNSGLSSITEKFNPQQICLPAYVMTLQHNDTDGLGSSASRNPPPSSMPMYGMEIALFNEKGVRSGNGVVPAPLIRGG